MLTVENAKGLTYEEEVGMKDNYGKHWDYPVFSELDIEPDAPNSGRRPLHTQRRSAGNISLLVISRA